MLMHVAISLVAILLAVAIALPSILIFFGFHPDYNGEEYNLKGKKALIVTTSHGVLNKPGETTGNATGVFGSEMTIPYKTRISS